MNNRIDSLLTRQPTLCVGHTHTYTGVGQKTSLVMNFNVARTANPLDLEQKFVKEKEEC